ETIILKALSKEPGSRYATAGELAADLRRFLEHRPIQARRPGPLERARKWSRRHPTLVWSVAVGVLVLALAAGYLVRGRQARQEELALRTAVALDETERLYRRGRWQEAREAARRTRQLLRPEAEAGPLEQRVRQWLVDLDLVERLTE